MKTVISVTPNPTVDASSSVAQVIPDSKLRCTQPTHQPGGGGINVSSVIAELGGRSTAVFPAGGFHGAKLKQLIASEGIECRVVSIEGSTRENFMFVEETSGRQYRFGMSGPKLDKEEWGAILDEVRDSKPRPGFVVASGSLSPGVPEDFYARLSGIVTELGGRLIVDASGEPLRQAVLSGVYMIKPNMRELCELSGEEVRDQWQVRELAREVVQSGRVEIVVVSMGAAGALGVSKKIELHVSAPAVPIRSRVGAGDSLVAGIVLALAREESLREALRFGIAASSAAVMTPGTELCRREDVDRLYALMKEDGMVKEGEEVDLQEDAACE